MKHLVLLLSLVVLTSCGGGISSEVAVSEEEAALPLQADLFEVTEEAEELVDYEKVDVILADISAQMEQPNILKSDILRGWYLGSELEKKYGTPDTWIFVEDGAHSKWMSPNVLETEDLTDDRQLCRSTAGTYYASCLESSDSDCEYVDESYCQCLAGSQWKAGQGCILATERGTFVSINSAELEQGWYYGLPNEKKLNTPSDWQWVEHGRESVWKRVK